MKTPPKDGGGRRFAGWRFSHPDYPISRFVSVDTASSEEEALALVIKETGTRKGWKSELILEDEHDE